jgi:hypothetical protein
MERWTIQKPAQGKFCASGANTGLQDQDGAGSRTAKVGTARSAGKMFPRPECSAKEVRLAIQGEKDTRDIQVGFSQMAHKVRIRVAATR